MSDTWHLIEAKREGDDLPTMFRIRELEPRPELSTILVVELPYPVSDSSKLPGPAAYRRLGAFEQDWLVPAAAALGLEVVAFKTANGSMHAYLYGALADPQALVARLSPFDGGLAFYDDPDPEWAEYAALRELISAAKALQQRPRRPRAPTVVAKIRAKRVRKSTKKRTKPKSKAKQPKRR